MDSARLLVSFAASTENELEDGLSQKRLDSKPHEVDDYNYSSLQTVLKLSS